MADEDPPPPSSTSSWGTSSLVNEATPDNLASGSEELAAEQEKITEVTTKLLAVVSELGGGPLNSSPGLTEMLLTDWLGEKEDRGDALKGKVDRKPAPGWDRGEDGNQVLNLREAPIPARKLGSTEREGREQSRPAYLHKFPMLRRGRSKLEVKRSGLDVVVGGCNKRKAELIEKDLNKMEEQLE